MSLSSLGFVVLEGEGLDAEEELLGSVLRGSTVTIDSGSDAGLQIEFGSQIIGQESVTLTSQLGAIGLSGLIFGADAVTLNAPVVSVLDTAIVQSSGAIDVSNQGEDTEFDVAGVVSADNIVTTVSNLSLIHI